VTDFELLQGRLAELSSKLYPLFSEEFGDTVIGAKRSELLETAYELRKLGFDRLGMVTAVDRQEWFTIVYRLSSRALTADVFLKTRVPRDDAHLDSLCDVWPAANWQEREVFDLFGIVFDGHPDLRRILLPEGWEGFPLRKDYEDERLIRRPDYI
jgi:NADH-quinone oxidoreductase subunit C